MRRNLLHLRSILVHRILSNSRFSFTLLVALAALGVMAPSAHATLTTGNQFVSADVEDDGTGEVTWYVNDGAPPSGRDILSFQHKSFVTFLINGKYYSNNSYATTKDVYLNNGVTTKNGDHIVTTWTVDNMDLIQDVYPYAFRVSGQIVIKFSLRNRTSTIVNCQAQYLLDTDPTNDGAKLLTRYDYANNQVYYPNPNAGLPPFFLCAKNDPPPGASATPPFQLGPTGVGYWTDTTLGNVLGLKRPSKVWLGHWPSMVQTLWGYNVSGTPYSDGAVLTQWPATGTADTATIELGRMSYGTGEFDICMGNLFSIIFYPHKLSWDNIKKNYNPNPFTVEALVFNPSDQTGLSAMTGTITVGYHLTVLNPTPVTGGGKVQTQPAPFGGAVAPSKVADFIWKVQSDTLKNCSADSDTYFNLTYSYQGLPTPPFREACDLPVTLECTSTDNVAPIYDPATGHLGTGANDFLDSSFNVHDNSLTDMGMRDVSWKFNPPSASTNFTVSTTPGLPLSGCPKTNVTVDVRQLDSTKAGCIDFTFVDCAGNVSYREMCFSAHPVPNVPDNFAPVISLSSHSDYPDIPNVDSNCNAQCGTYTVTELQTGDRGLRRIQVKPSTTPTNMRLTVTPFPFAATVAHFDVCVIDSMLNGSIVVEAEDTVGHLTDTTITYCTVPDVTRPIVKLTNTGRGMWHVHVTDSAAWDRGIDSVHIFNDVNVQFSPAPNPGSHLKAIYDFDANVVDTFQSGGFCVQAYDMAGNVDKLAGTCTSYDPLEDIWRPNITTTPAITTNPISIDVKVDDIHLDAFGKPINYDTGIDSVWFTGVHGMTLKINGYTFVSGVNPWPVIRNRYDSTNFQHRFAMTLDSVQNGTFTIMVTDTSAVDSLSCVTINVADGAGRIHPGKWNTNQLQWCYPSAIDTLPPIMTGKYAPDYSGINLVVSDERLRDQGLGSVKFKNGAYLHNFDPFDQTYPGDKSTSITLKVTTPHKSARGTVVAEDLYGAKLGPAGLLTHSAEADVSIIFQDMHLKVGRVVESPGTFDVPLYLVQTDDMPIDQKRLSSFAFDFHLLGSNLVTFQGPITTGTTCATWTVTAPANANPRGFTLNAVAPAGTYLTDTSTTKPLLYLRFNSAPSDYSAATNVLIDGPNEIRYNGGGDTVMLGQSSSVILPAPQGSVSGGTIIIKGKCSPEVTIGGSPSVIGLAPNSPNPWSSATDVEYSIPNEGFVKLELYNALGEKVRTVVSETQKPGTYQLQITRDGLSEGAYFLRLESGGEVMSRRVMLTK